MKNVLIISRALPNNSPVSIRHNNIKRYLSRYVRQITLINLAEKSFIYSNENIIKKILGPAIRKLPLLPDTDLLLLPEYKKKIKQALSDFRCDTVIIGVLPISFLSLAKYLKHIDKELNVIVDMSDPISINAAFSSWSILKQKFLLSFEKKYLSYVDTLVVLNKEIKNHYENTYALNKVIVMEQGIDESFTNFKNKESKSGIVNLLYAGAFYENVREPHELYKAIEMCKCNIRLDIYGRFIKRFYPPRNNKFNYGGAISIQQLLSKYFDSDIIVFIDNKNSIQIPGKTLEILALNKPVLFIYFDDNSPTLNYMKDKDGIFKVKNNAYEIKNKIEEIISLNILTFERDLSSYYWSNLINKLLKYV